MRWPLPSNHRIRNSSSGGLRPSTLPLGHGGSPQYRIFTSERRKPLCFFRHLNASVVFEPAASDSPKHAVLTTVRVMSSQSSHHPQEVLLAQFSLYVHKGGLKPDSFHLYGSWFTKLDTWSGDSRLDCLQVDAWAQFYHNVIFKSWVNP